MGDVVSFPIDKAMARLASTIVATKPRHEQLDEMSARIAWIEHSAPRHLSPGEADLAALRTGRLLMEHMLTLRRYHVGSAGPRPRSPASRHSP